MLATEATSLQSHSRCSWEVIAFEPACGDVSSAQPVSGEISSRCVQSFLVLGFDCFLDLLGSSYKRWSISDTII